MKKTMHFLFACCILLCSLVLFACDNHSHEYSKLNHDEKEHWHECTCGEIDKKEVHSFGQWTESTSGQKRTCTVCGYEETSASISHKFSEEVIAPTCTEKGYTKKVCSDCGLEVRENYKDPFGHQGVTICSVCGEKILDNTFFKNLLSSLEKNSIAVKVNNFSLKISSETYESQTDITFAELLCTVNEKGEITGYGSFDVVGQETPFNSVGHGMALIKNDKLYIKWLYTLELIEHTFDAASWEYLADDEQTIYLVYDINELDAEGETRELKTIIDFLKSLPALTQKIKENEDKLALILSGVFPKVFDRVVTEGGYQFTLDFDKLADLADKACTLKISELIDAIFGEGVFEQIEAIVPNLFDYKIAEVMDLLEEAGLTLVDLFDALDAMIQQNMGEEYNLKAILVMISGKEELDGTALEILRSPLFKDVTLKQFLANFDLNTDDLKPALESYVAMAKEFTILDLLASIQAEQASEDEVNIKDILVEYVKEFGKNLNISIFTDVKGNFLQFNASGSIIIPDETESMETSFDLEFLTNLDLVKDYASFETEIKTKTNVSLEKFGELLVAAGYEAVKEDGKIVAFKKVEVEEDLYRYEMGENMYCISTSTSTVEVRHNIDEIEFTQFLDNCGDWIEIGTFMGAIISSKYENTNKYYENDVLVNEESSTPDTYEYTTSNYFNLYINLKTNEYKLSEDQHDFVLDETKTKEPVGCTDIGELHYTCSKCGLERSKYYINGHSDIIYSYEFLTEVKSCRAGVLVKGYCGRCKEPAFAEEYEYHYNIGYFIDLGDANICEEHKLRFYDCPCGEERGFSCDLSFDGSSYKCEICGLTITVAEDTKLEGCFSTTTYTYTFYVNEEKVKDLQYDIVKNRHYYDQMEFEIMDDGILCYDGWVLIGHCKMCDQTIVETGSTHKKLTMKLIDLSEYGGEGYLSIQSCPCGMEYRIQSSFFSRYSSEIDEQGNIFYICDNDPSFIIKDEQVFSHKGSYELITHTFYIGYNRETGSYKDSFSVDQLQY